MSEHDEQAALIELCRLHEGQYPALCLIYAIPNGGARDAITGARLKREGVKPGVPDLCLPVSRKGHGAMYVEMKHGKNKPQPAQEAWIDALTDEGNRVVVCYSAEAALAELLDYLTP